MDKEDNIIDSQHDLINKKPNRIREVIESALVPFSKLVHLSSRGNNANHHIRNHQDKGITDDTLYIEVSNILNKMIAFARQDKSPDIKSVRDVVKEIISQAINNKYTLMNLNTIKSFDDYTFKHSVNVCVLSTVIGKRMGLDKNELINLALGSIVHDIGKVKIPAEIIFKPGKLTDEEFEMIKLHPKYGYEILSNTDGVNNDILDITLQHHEKWNGKGYPNQLSGKQINKLARICTVSDIYDAMTSTRVYKKAIEPVDSAIYLFGRSGVDVDPTVMKVFSSSVDIYLGQCRAVSMNYSDELSTEYFLCQNHINGIKYSNYDSTDYIVNSRLNILNEVLKDNNPKLDYSSLTRMQIRDLFYEKIHKTLRKSGVELEKEHYENPVFKRGDVVGLQDIKENADDKYIFLRTLISDLGLVAEVVHSKLYEESKEKYSAELVRHIRICVLRRYNPEY